MSAAAVPTPAPPTGAPGSAGVGTGYDEALLVRRYGPRRAQELVTLTTGRRPPGRRHAGIVEIVLTVVAAIALTWVYWAWRGSDDHAVHAQLVSYTIPASGAVSVTWTVSRDPATTVSCRITATDQDSGVVGQDRALVPAGGARATQVVTSLKTIRPATGVTVDGCATESAPLGGASPGSH